MLNGMSTIEMIENLKIENFTENRVIRRFEWPPTNYGRPKCIFTKSTFSWKLKILELDIVWHNVL